LFLDLDPAKVDRAIKLSADKYCSASIMIGKTATITHNFEIREPGMAPSRGEYSKHFNKGASAARSIDAVPERRTDRQ
jgi:hypothetical protein